jgi:hypothetical protein
VKIAIVPATRSDLAACFGRSGHFNAVGWTMALAQFEAGPSWAAVAENGATLAVGGLVPLAGGDEAAAWFVATPAAAPAMRAIVRGVRLTFEASPYGAIRVEAWTRAGVRLARLIGFDEGERDGCHVENVWRRRQRRREDGAGAARPQPVGGAGGADPAARGGVA